MGRPKICVRGPDNGGAESEMPKTLMAEGMERGCSPPPSLADYSLGERRKLPRGVRGRAPAEKTSFGVFGTGKTHLLATNI